LLIHISEILQIDRSATSSDQPIYIGLLMHRLRFSEYIYSEF